MKVAILSESATDEEAIRVLVGGILGRQTQPVEYFQPRSRGWPSILDVLPTVLMHLYYRTDAEALVVVADSDDSPVHVVRHEQPDGVEKDCRLCKLRYAVGQTQRKLSPVTGRQTIKTAVGLAVPAIEAWYLCGRDPQVSEAAWQRGVQSRPGSPARKRLKRAVYGSEFLTEGVARRRAIEETQRLAGDLTLLQTLFPGGFGSLVRDLRTW
jgi:hypothetical protein